MKNFKFKSLLFYIKKISYELYKLVLREIYYYRIKPTEALFFLTYRCTSRCRMCEMWKRGSSKNELGLDGWKKVVDMVHSLNIKTIYLFGGDALLRKDILLPFIKYIKSKDIYCNITINGNLLDKEMASILVTSGIDCVWISVDGIGEVCDRIRGRKGSFERIRSGLKNLLEERENLRIPKIALNCTISSLNINDFEEVLPFAINLCGIDEVDFEYVGEIRLESAQKSQIDGYIPSPYFINREESILLNIEQAIFLKKKLKEMKKIAWENSINISTRNIDCLSIENMTTGIFPNKKCYLCRYHVNIDPMGNVIPCLFFESYHLGNVNEEELCKIWGNQKHRRFLQYVEAKKFDMCKHCVVGIQRNPTFFQSVSRLTQNVWNTVKLNLFNK